MNYMNWDRGCKNRYDYDNCECHNKDCHHSCYDNCQQNCHHHCSCDEDCCHNFSRCNNGNLGPLSITLAAPTFSQTLNLPIANVTNNIHDPHFSSPVINFSGNLTIQSTVAPVNVILTFTLFKTCRGNVFRQPISTFTSTTNLAAANVSQTQSLNFQAFSCLCFCDSCCTYSLELTTVSANVPASLNFSISGMLCVQP